MSATGEAAAPAAQPDGGPEATGNRWRSSEHALAYLARADTIPHRVEGEGVLLDFLPRSPRRVLDLGTGDGRLLALVLVARPSARGAAVDFSPSMLAGARRRFAGDDRVEVVEHDLGRSLLSFGRFDAVVSSFAIHHCSHERKRELYGEVFDLLQPGGSFLNLDHVDSPTPALHHRFLAALGLTPDQDDPSNILLDVHSQLGWLRELGFREVDCHWKWLEMALLAGVKPAEPSTHSRP